MKENVKVNLLKAVEKVVEVRVDLNGKMWPPICIGFLHQPKRPKINK